MSNNGIDIAGIDIVSGYSWGREVFWDGLCSEADSTADGRLRR